MAGVAVPQLWVRETVKEWPSADVALAGRERLPRAFPVGLLAFLREQAIKTSGSVRQLAKGTLISQSANFRWRQGSTNAPQERPGSLDEHLAEHNELQLI